MPRPLRLAAESAGGGRRAQPARAARRHRQRGRPRRRAGPSPAISLRTGDTPSSERARFLRDPGDILITTPESLYLMLTSNARERLQSVETVIIDEIHALVSTKRGAHLALSLERLELLDRAAAAAHRPVGDAAAAGGGRAVPRGSRQQRPKAGQEAKASKEDRKRPEGSSRPSWTTSSRRRGTVDFRDVTIIDAREPKRLDIRVQVPIEDMAKVGAAAHEARTPADSLRAGGAVAGAAVDLDGHPSAAARAHSVASLDAASSSTAGASPSGSRARSTSWQGSRSCARITGRWRARSASRSKTC